LPDVTLYSAETLTSQTLNYAFSTFAQLRQPRTASLVKGAQSQGKNTVVDGGPEECAARDERLRRGWADDEAVEKRYDMLLKAVLSNTRVPRIH
jgi:salicylate hydroxylase